MLLPFIDLKKELKIFSSIRNFTFDYIFVGKQKYLIIFNYIFEPKGIYYYNLEINYTSTIMTDQQIIVTIKGSSVKNCESTFDYVYKNYYNMIENFIKQNSGTQDDAKDVFQETVISLYKNVKNDKYSPDSKLSTYLFSISKNIWFKKIRKKSRMTNLEDNNHLQLSSDENIHDSIEYTEHQKLIGTLLHKVGQECNKLLKLFYFEKMRMVKIASKMDYSTEQIARNQKSKCMKKLRIVVLSSDNLQEQLRDSY